jgi:polyisoprenoid-binding protein YceI
MKKTVILIMALAFISMSFTHTIKAVKSNLKVDVTNSTIKWKGYKPTGSHEGTILLQTGNIELEDGKIVGGSFVVDMTSIKDADGSERLEGHLKSPDFFDVEIYGTSNFKISKVTYEGAKILVTGTMTIKGISKEITFPATVNSTVDSVTLSSETFQINRADFNVKYKSKSFFNDLKDKFVNDEFDLQVIIVAKK